MTTKTRAEQLALATSILAELGYVWKIWTDEDVREEILQQKPDVTRRQLRELTEAAKQDSAFRALAECTDQDWTGLAYAVDAAIEDMEDAS